MINVKKDNLKYREDYYIKNKEKIKKYSKKYYKNNFENISARDKKNIHTLKRRFIVYKTNAKRKGLIFVFTLNEFSEIINKPCYYCGENSGGIDRLDSSIGYLKDNCVPCCAICNYMKNKYTEDEFLDQCMKITDYRGSKR